MLIMQIYNIHAMRGEITMQYMCIDYATLHIHPTSQWPGRVYPEYSAPLSGVRQRLNSWHLPTCPLFSSDDQILQNCDIHWQKTADMVHVHLRYRAHGWTNMCVT